MTKQVELLTSQIVEDLNNGLSWLKSEDLGFGSIQEKYGAKELQVQMIRKHPRLKDLEPSITVFKVIDDLDVNYHPNQPAVSRATSEPEVAVHTARTPSAESAARTTTTNSIGNEDHLASNGSPVGQTLDPADELSRILAL